VIVVLDTNVWISALQFAKRRGMPAQALEKAMSDDVIASCAEIEAEILRVLTQRFLWELNRAHAAIEAVLARAIRVQLHGTVKGAATLATICSSSARHARTPICGSQETKIFWFSALTKEHAFLLPPNTSEAAASSSGFRSKVFDTGAIVCGTSAKCTPIHSKEAHPEYGA
jgi:hypothetical protein